MKLRNAIFLAVVLAVTSLAEAEPITLIIKLLDYTQNPARAYVQLTLETTATCIPQSSTGSIGGAPQVFYPRADTVTITTLTPNDEITCAGVADSTNYTVEVYEQPTSVNAQPRLLRRGEYKFSSSPSSQNLKDLTPIPPAPPASGQPNYALRNANNSFTGVQDFTDATLVGVGAASVPDADATTKGKLQLAGDLGGTAAAPTVPALANKEDKANKGAVNGYAPLDGTGKVPSANLPATGGAVASVFGRTGTVAAQSGDYTAAQVGAIPATDKASANGVASLDAGSKVPIAQVPTGTSGTTVALGNHAHTGVYEPANANIQAHIASTANPHSVTKSQVGLGSVPNVDVTNAANLASGTVPPARLPGEDCGAGNYQYGRDVTGAPLCRADQVGTPGSGITSLNGDTSSSQTFANGTGIAVSTNTSTHVHTIAFSGNKTTVGLSNVDNTSDAAKPVSAAQQAALDLKESLSNKGNANGYASLDASTRVPIAQIPLGTTASTAAAGNDSRITGAVQGTRALTGGAGIAAIGDLSADRTIATDSSEADFLKSGALTCGAGAQGKAQVHTTPLQYCDNAATPALKYAAYGDSAGKATSAATADAANTASNLSGTPALPNGTTATTQAANDASTKLATTAYADTGLALKAPLASPALTGTPTVPTAAPGTSTTQVANTAFVQNAVAASGAEATPALSEDATYVTSTKIVKAPSFQTTGAATSDDYTEIAAPASPAAGHLGAWADSTDHRIHDKNASGVVGTTVVGASARTANQFVTNVKTDGTQERAAIVAADVPTLNQNTTGTASNVSGTPALPNGTTATTQTAGDATTKLATDAFVDTAVTNRVTTHATDCTALTSGRLGDLCVELDSERLFSCQPTAGGCDTPGEWILTGDGTTAGGLATTDIDTSAELRTIVTDESGTGALIFAGGNIGAATATTAAANDNSIKVATTAYADAAAAARTGTIASGTAALGTSSIAANTCATVVTVAATGVATTDVIQFTPNADISAVTGYTPGGTLKIIPYPTANNVNFKVCNADQTNAVVPGAVTLNFRVVR